MSGRDLIDIGALEISYHINAAVTRERTVKERRPFVQKVVRSFTEALQFIKTNKKETKALIGKKSEDQRLGRIRTRLSRLQWRVPGGSLKGESHRLS